GTNSTTLTAAQIGTLSATRYFRAVVTNGVCAPDESDVITVNVDPLPVIGDFSTEICDGETFIIEPVDGTDGNIVPAGTTYTWAVVVDNPDVTGDEDELNPQSEIFQTLINNTDEDQVVVYTVTPTSAEGCLGADFEVIVTVNPTPLIIDEDPLFSICITNSIVSSPFIQAVSGNITGIDQDGDPGVNGLPPGISASFNQTTKEIEFSGTATTTGIYNYTIPLEGDCTNGLTATGTIDVTPEYELTSVTSISASSVGGQATITINGDPNILTDGEYYITYTLIDDIGNEEIGVDTLTISNGKGSFKTDPLPDNDAEVYQLIIETIQKTTGGCIIDLNPDDDIDPNTDTFFSVCGATFTESGTFYVPANIYEITIQVWGAGAGGAGKNRDGSGGGGGGFSSITLPVTPGEPIGIVVGQGGTGGKTNGDAPTNGGDSYATRDSSLPDQESGSLVYAYGGTAPTTTTVGQGGIGNVENGQNGFNATSQTGGKGGDAGGGGGTGGAGGSGNGNNDGLKGGAPGGGGGGAKQNADGGDGANGFVLISYSCPDADKTDCIEIVDDGAISGTTIIEFTCDDTWYAPEGLADFTVYVGGGGGGGGGGEGSGGGGAGGLVSQTFTVSNPYGMPAGTEFELKVGDGGPGAKAINQIGENGEPSSFKGIIDGDSVKIVVPGGGGGGSVSFITGGSGASGGGGGAQPNESPGGGAFGVGGAVESYTYSGPNVTVYMGQKGGDGDFSSSQNSVAGGGGSGLYQGTIYDGAGGKGKAAGNGQGEGGRGGDGIAIGIEEYTLLYGAGGGGIGEYFNGTEKVGIGGSASGIKIGGNGNLSGPTARGENGRPKTGSGGGAGYGGGGNGGSGIIVITYYNFAILPIEYLYFEANYNPADRTGLVSWATAKEWENSHFEIERSVNGINNWEKIGEVAGAGYSMEPVEYKFL
ncbi:MAG: hypothetical protein HWE07_02775, partial [Cytophagia bacterium]|nr:hypothetical protein [Cytophagia bacterium]